MGGENQQFSQYQVKINAKAFGKGNLPSVSAFIFNTDMDHLKSI